MEHSQVIENMERETGIEPATSSLGSWHSTAELLPLSVNPYLLAQALYCQRQQGRFNNLIIYHAIVCHAAPSGMPTRNIRPLLNYGVSTTFIKLGSP
jgi:hypothetical protein